MILLHPLLQLQRLPSLLLHHEGFKFCCRQASSVFSRQAHDGRDDVPYQAQSYNFFPRKSQLGVLNQVKSKKMLNYATQRNRKNIVLWELLAADIQCIESMRIMRIAYHAYHAYRVSRIMRIAYHAYRVSCVTLGKMKGNEKK